MSDHLYLEESSQRSELHIAKEIWSTQKTAEGHKLVAFKDAALLTNHDGRIVKITPVKDLSSSSLHNQHQVVNHGDGIIVPGFVDPHLHCPQLDVIGSGGLPLLDWLNSYVFPAESKFSSREIARRGAQRLSRELRRNGVTTAAVFSSVHAIAADELFNEFDQAGLRLVSGKTSMDCGAPATLLQASESDLIEQESLIEKWHGRSNRLLYAITPRFALSCSPRMLRSLGDLRAKNPSCLVQTHISENIHEVAEVRRQWKDQADYLAVYEDYGLLSDKTLLAHGVYLSDMELTRIAKSKATVVHCPTSNSFLGSGLFSLRRSLNLGVRVCLASDIGGGTSLSPWQTMLESYKVQALQGDFVSAVDLFYRATLAGAEALGLDTICGSLDVGKSADFVVLQPKANQLLAERLDTTKTAEERLFALMTFGDDRIVSSTYVSGVAVFKNVENLQALG